MKNSQNNVNKKGLTAEENLNLLKDQVKLIDQKIESFQSKITNLEEEIILLQADKIRKSRQIRTLEYSISKKLKQESTEGPSKSDQPPQE